MSHNLHLSEINKDQLEQEIICINKEKADILEQLQHINRQKNALAEDLILAKKDIERLSDNHIRLTKETFFNQKKLLIHLFKSYYLNFKK